MIFAKPTRHGAGIIIHGDYSDLTNLYESVCNLAENSVHEVIVGEFTLGLAHEIRKAYEGKPEQHEFKREFLGSETDTYFPFQELWPNFLMQLAILRWVAGFPTHE
ncbi:MAG TPA: hypothetical protein DC054_06550 [Blastocatellia bacterium]|nr:hypothetical protein [Blastocatellia bacterium]